MTRFKLVPLFDNGAPSALGKRHDEWLADHVRGIARERAAWEDRELRRLLALWVSELEPVMVYQEGRLRGLSADGHESTFLIVAEPWPEPAWYRSPFMDKKPARSPTMGNWLQVTRGRWP